MKHRVLVTTLPPTEGGVPAKARHLCEHLRSRGHDVTVAWYATRSEASYLCAGLWGAIRGRVPQTEAKICFDSLPGVAVGCWLPEIEAPYYLPSSRWQALVRSHDRHVAIGGNMLVSYPLVHYRVPHFVWFASRVIDDRVDRQRAMPWLRRVYDRSAVVPMLEFLEARILNGHGHLAPVGLYAQKQVVAAGRATDTITVLTIPTDTRRFTPPVAEPPVGVVGFAGRLGDPRKNLRLLIEAVAHARAQGCSLQLNLAGSDPPPEVVRHIHSQNMESAVRFYGKLDPGSLPDFYRSLDVFAIPSAQEGFGIVGIEALAAGVPIVTTRCGGPEEFVLDDRTGFVVPHDPVALATRLMQIVGDRSLRGRLSQEARKLAVERYDISHFPEAVARVWRSVWGEEP